MTGLVAFGIPVVIGCGTSTMEPEDVTEVDPLAELVDETCPSIFHQNILPEYRITISDAEWGALEYEFLHRQEREELGLDPNPYHPIEFEYQGESYPNVMIKLKGQSSWRQAISFDADPKMQFIIAFNEVDPEGRFYGVRKLSLDMPRTDGTFLRQRLGLYFLRRGGISAQCANNARLVINGEYYGLYTNLEKLDKEFLQRVFGDQDEGDLWESGLFPRTNEESAAIDRRDAFWAATSVEELESFVDLEASVRVWAHEAAAPHADGYYNGRANFYLYDHPEGGLRWISHDLDSTFDFVPSDLSILYPHCEFRHPNDRIHWSLVLSSDRWLRSYADHLQAARDSYDEAVLEDLVAAWSRQIYESAADDPMKPFTTADHEYWIEHLRSFPRARANAADDWLMCFNGDGEDADADGTRWCLDCDEENAAVHPDAEETCNGIDDDCDWLVDEQSGGDSC